MCGFEFHVLLNCIHYSRLRGFSLLYCNTNVCSVWEGCRVENTRQKHFHMYSPNSLPEGLEWAGIYAVFHWPRKNQLETDLKKIHQSSLLLKPWILIWQPPGTLPGPILPVNLLKLQKIIRVKLMCRMLSLRRRFASGKSHKDHLFYVASALTQRLSSWSHLSHNPLIGAGKLDHTTPAWSCRIWQHAAWSQEYPGFYYQRKIQPTFRNSLLTPFIT